MLGSLWIFRPLAVLLASLASGFLYGVWVTWRFTGDARYHQYLYDMPIVVPFVAFIFDRLEQLRRTSGIVLGVDVMVVATSIMRARGYVPLISGHALFLTYAILRPGSLVTRLAAALVMLEVVYLKFFVWHDFVTPVGGIALAGLAALIVRRFESYGPSQPTPESAGL